MELNFTVDGKLYNLRMQQQDGTIPFMRLLIEILIPYRVIELGTGSGGLGVVLSAYCRQYGMRFDTYEHQSGRIEPVSEQLIRVNLGKIHYVDIFDISSQIGDDISDKGRTLVLCDNGNKELELNTFAAWLKPDDFIMVHDYWSNRKTFANDFVGTGNCEIDDQSVNTAIQEHGLRRYAFPGMEKLLWVILQKL